MALIEIDDSDYTGTTLDIKGEPIAIYSRASSDEPCTKWVPVNKYAASETVYALPSDMIFKLWYFCPGDKDPLTVLQTYLKDGVGFLNFYASLEWAETKLNSLNDKLKDGQSPWQLYEFEYVVDRIAPCPP